VLDVATITRSRNKGGTVSFVAQVRIKPFKPVAKSFPTKGEAQTWAATQERELIEHRDQSKVVAVDLPRFTVGQLIRQFLDDPTTHSLGYYEDLVSLLAWWTNEYGNERVLQFGATTLRAARKKLLSGRANGTVNRYLSAMRSCWNWARGAEVIPSKLVWPPKLMLKEPKAVVRFLSDDELVALLGAATKHSQTMRAAILASIATGVRMSELRRFQWSDIDFERKRLRVLLSKNNESRGGYLPEAAVSALKDLMGAPGEAKGHVFCTDEGKPVSKDWVSYRWQLIREAAGLKNFRWHDLRHSCASLLAQNGATLLEIGTVLGHKSPSVTAKYAHLVDGAPVTGHAKLDEKLKGKLS
jgi:integrase